MNNDDNMSEKIERKGLSDNDDIFKTSEKIIRSLQKVQKVGKTDNVLKMKELIRDMKKIR